MGGVAAHLVRVLLLQDVNLFGGLTLTHHFLYDKSVTGRLMSSWSPLAPGTSFSTHLCVD